MIDIKKFVEHLRTKNVVFFTGVPDSLLKDFCAYISDNFDDKDNIIAANEGNAIGIACGYHFSTQNIPLVYMQNSGFGNCVNPLLSLVDEKVYNIPLLLMIGWRGEPGKKDEPQHLKQGEVTIELLETMGIEYCILNPETNVANEEINNAIKYIEKTNKPYALIVRKGTFDSYKKTKNITNDFELSREDALKIIVKSLDTNSVIVSTTGKLSRELFEYREELGQGHEKDFLTVGSMGHSSQIALGIALNSQKRKVYCLDGDGSIIMHTGGMGIIGNLKPTNYVHIVLNNGAHESVGGQKTIGFNVDFKNIAKSFGYNYYKSIGNESELNDELNYITNISGPIFLEVKVGINSRKDLGRPTKTPIENKIDFINFLNND